MKDFKIKEELELARCIACDTKKLCRKDATWGHICPKCDDETSQVNALDYWSRR